MADRIYNFNPGPATLPLPALKKAQEEFLNYRETGMSIIETSHRSPEFEGVLEDTKSLIKELLKVPDDYHILFLGGGASLQFAMIAMNFIPEAGSADYINTGTWSTKAIKEAGIIARHNVAATSEDKNFCYIPEKFNFDPNAAYVHITTNNTIKGTQWHEFPDTAGKPLLADMSSDIMSRTLDVAKFAMIYAGAQKNLGPSGVTVIMIQDEFAKTAREGLPTMLSYDTHIKKNSLFNTPPVFPIYMVKLVMEWIKDQGGLEEVDKINRKKADLIYDAIDGSDGYYKGTAQKKDRSIMNLTMRMENEDLEKKFISKAKEKNLHGLKGHRSVGGIRASMYNAFPLEGAEKLAEFMQQFKKNN
ncbi:MAG: 3-phosphoserine/phosphohydroxythreonine transaminase [candidate division Zixibacteria bacterium]|nr:3-phosphoserine/phosphohydroxythreonine transaminase [candidate division Zixibacteria bacterium]NIR62381.1 3-phosphoserine/phosphohydroxythreonine transaminase [candidate division Zixibacteria bacterium]NIS14990.1 3-phosphoserine/phosphohydroxythreonine transaminase [candidate division Zixibacteria bacterium]NIS44557.1 3-phosphoserine/phosphohydroxythreonine transaminase [candidate division Zixibacteria bacterium]NIT51514.1 3-phosphoserine/phosphohydroxythreonine transaminase [candidate divi